MRCGAAVLLAIGPQPHTKFVPPPPQLSGPVHGPQSRTPLQLFDG